ncbi:hypothetical protein ON010_g2669 [Phytophthora cinnamomi]|nr:hypothetical protein ON010_g2669 [Phytophthora cinnamomi]
MHREGVSAGGQSSLAWTRTLSGARMYMSKALGGLGASSDTAASNTGSLAAAAPARRAAAATASLLMSEGTVVVIY